MTEDEAREAAWREWSHGLKPTESMSPGACFYAGWDAARKYDEQRIAVLVKAVKDEHEDFHKVWVQGSGREGIAPPISECRNPLCRALAGQTEEVPND